jgi:site-specific recombinase XerD
MQNWPQPCELKSTHEMRSGAAKTGPSSDASNGIGTAEIMAELEDWLWWCKAEGHSPKTAQLKRDIFNRLHSFLIQNEYSHCGPRELVHFFGALCNAVTGEALRPSTTETYHRYIKAFFNHLVKKGTLQSSPMASVPRPRVPEDDIGIIEEEQFDALMDALNGVRSLKQRRRDRAIILLFFDSGLRVSELISIKYGDLELKEQRVRVLGKGNKKRTVYYGVRTSRALWQYLQGESRQENESLFLACTGPNAGKPLTRWAVAKMMRKLAKRAGIKGVRVSPHTLRHTCATRFLQNYGDLKACQKLLGHTTWRMTQRYNSIAEADLREQHRRASPVDRMGKH